MTGRTRKVCLTDARVGRLRPAQMEYVLWDTRVTGLGVRVRPSGHRSYVWHGRANGAAVRATIGSAALKTVEEARRESLALQNATELSGTEIARDRTVTPLFRGFAMNVWKAATGHRWGPSRRSYVDRMLNKQLLPNFGRLRLDRIRRVDVECWFDAYSRTAPGGANSALQLLRQILKFAVETGHITTNPSHGIRRNPRRKLTRFLSGDEINRLHLTLNRLVAKRPSRQLQADIIRLLLLTGCRKGEILKLRWSEVEGDVLRLTETKTGPRRVWLNKESQAIFARQPRAGSAYVFPSPKDPARPCSDSLGLWYRVRMKADIDDVRLHDLRHTVASQAVAGGVALSTVARMLGHSDPTMTLRYAHVSDRDVDDAVERIGKAIMYAMKTGKPINGTSSPC